MEARDSPFTTKLISPFSLAPKRSTTALQMFRCVKKIKIDFAARSPSADQPFGGAGFTMATPFICRGARGEAARSERGRSMRCVVKATSRGDPVWRVKADKQQAHGVKLTTGQPSQRANAIANS
ncbi:unnamed protein product [Pleuronectes platessa]|uniref:Uncharacterized protein n=1 Tax=Pleuronectes platessa TaxID=8262 RepID=A0A9N7TZ87_PLEPL|nr:unnamed protein product [Pleuronectes platessa]